VLTARERRAFDALTETLLAPAPPLPPVSDTDARAGFELMLSRAPKLNRVALRGLLMALGRRSPAKLVARAERVPQGRQLVDAVRSAVAVSYYGDAGVQRLLGYDP
jgi:hypothetical protein